MEDSDIDYYTIAAMIKYGGGFVHQLGILFRTTDDGNKQKLKTAFPEYWEQYSKLGKQLAEEEK